MIEQNINQPKANPIVLVTGASRGIGYAIAQEFLNQGFTTVVTTRDGSLPKGLEGAHPISMDVSLDDSVANGFALIEKEFGTVDVLVANAGITKDTLLLRMNESDFQEVLNTNLTGVFRCAKAASKGMLKKHSGSMIFIGSVVGLMGSAGQVNYAATKAGLVGMARSLAREFGSRNITVNVVAPGFVETDMTSVLDEKRKNEIIEAVPLKRLSQPAEIAQVVTFLASSAARYITGAVIPVDGGLGMGH